MSMIIGFGVYYSQLEHFDLNLCVQDVFLAKQELWENINLQITGNVINKNEWFA